MDEILKILKSIDFWTIVSGVAAVIGLAVTFFQIWKSRSGEQQKQIAESMYRMTGEFEARARELMIAFEALSDKVSAGTQNDDEGQRLTGFINDGGLKLRTKGIEIMNHPNASGREIETLKDSVETVYQTVAAITRNKSGTLETLNNAILALQSAKENAFR